jgi:hypothetical protein
MRTNKSKGKSKKSKGCPEPGKDLKFKRQIPIAIGTKFKRQKSKACARLA